MHQPDENHKVQLSVEFSENIATCSIVERIVAAHLGQLFYIDGRSNLDYLPLAAHANKKIAAYDNSVIIQQTLDYLKITGHQQDLTFHALLRSRPFQASGFDYTFESLDVDSVKLAAVKTYVENLRQFYVQRNLHALFKHTQQFIKGAINEVRSNLPPSYVERMEEYYGENVSEFRFYVNPFDVVPYDTSFWHGNGPKIKTDTGWLAMMISSAYLPLKAAPEITGYKTFGFNHFATINLLVTHEFGHSFVNPAVDPFFKDINRTDSLLTSYSGWKSKMDSLGYGYWPFSITEHIVRLGYCQSAGHCRRSLYNGKPVFTGRLEP